MIHQHARSFEQLLLSGCLFYVPSPFDLSLHWFYRRLCYLKLFLMFVAFVKHLSTFGPHCLNRPSENTAARQAFQEKLSYLTILWLVTGQFQHWVYDFTARGLCWPDPTLTGGIFCNYLNHFILICMLSLSYNTWWIFYINKSIIQTHFYQFYFISFGSMGQNVARRVENITCGQCCEKYPRVIPESEYTYCVQIRLQS